ncbi:FHA domain-containing protein [Schlesneria sp. T3-172]|uniref:FHA domain-containing protein n=1 Tax=Schlesneria sphaerica TaxID=3373610 RepID=UPI0037C8B88D
MLQAELKILGGKHQGKIIPLATKKFLVGREQDCHLRPNSDLVSRHHCVFSIDEYAIRLRDLGSTNGTLVNGTSLRGEVNLKSGDRVSIGKLELEVIIRQATAKSSPRPAAAPEPVAELSSGLSTTELPSSSEETETSYEMPAYVDPAAAGMPTQDTAIIGAPVPLQYPPQGMPGYPQGYPGYPPMVPPGYQMPPGYMPGAYPQYPPGYGQPPGYPPQMGYPMGYPQMMPMQGYPGGAVAAPVEEPEPDAAAPSGELAVRLPNPEDTGVKTVAPAAAPAGGAKQEEKPSNTAADIIKQYMNRRS